jgi:hypothetical protein
MVKESRAKIKSGSRTLEKSSDSSDCRKNEFLTNRNTPTIDQGVHADQL